MSKEVHTKLCLECESEYKLMFDLNGTSGHPKFCPFCAAEIYEIDDDDEEEERK